MNFEDQFNAWLFAQGMAAGDFAELAEMEIEYEEHVAEFDAEFLKEAKVAA